MACQADRQGVSGVRRASPLTWAMCPIFLKMASRWAGSADCCAAKVAACRSACRFGWIEADRLDMKARMLSSRPGSVSIRRGLPASSAPAGEAQASAASRRHAAWRNPRCSEEPGEATSEPVLRARYAKILGRISPRSTFLRRPTPESDASDSKARA